MTLTLGCGVAPLNDDGTNAPEPKASDGCDLSERNAYGVCYPTEDIGTVPRDSKNKLGMWGNRIPNLRFTGFRAHGTDPIGARNTPETISLADLYDPLGVLGNVLIVINSNMAWCGPSNEEADFYSGSNYTGTNTDSASWVKELAPFGVVVLEVLNDGMVVGTAATVDDLRVWISHHESNYTSMLDGASMLSEYYSSMVYDPDTLVIDPRSMEILSASVGFNTNADVGLEALASSTRAEPPRP